MKIFKVTEKTFFQKRCQEETDKADKKCKNIFFLFSKKAKKLNKTLQNLFLFGYYFLFHCLTIKRILRRVCLEKNCSKNFYFDVSQFPIISDKKFCFKL